MFLKAYLLSLWVLCAFASNGNLYLTPINDGPKVCVKLSIVSPTNYVLRLEGLQGEKLTFRSTSADETIEAIIDTSEVSEFAILPGVIGKKGGFVDLKLIRENGEVSEISLPWGTEILGREMSIVKPLYAGFILPAKN